MPDFRSSLNMNGHGITGLLDGVSMTDAAAICQTLKIINVKDPVYGAIGDGSHNDTSAINAAIAAATGAASPKTTARTATAPVYFPPGTYKITSDLLIASTVGFRMFGAGPGNTTIYCSGTGFQTAPIFINGAIDGIFEGFQVEGDGTEQVNEAIRLDYVGASRTDAACGTTSGSAVVTNVNARMYDVGATITGTGIPAATTVISAVDNTGWTLSANATASGSVSLTVASVNNVARSTSANTFRDIRVRALKSIKGISLEGNGSQQLDGSLFENVVCSGSQTPGSWSSSGNWQKGIALGNGTFANNYDHTGVNLGIAGYFYGYDINASSLGLLGAQPANNSIDFHILPGSQSTFKNIQSQNAGQLCQMINSFSPTPVSFEDIQVKTSFLNTNGYVFEIFGGMTTIKNLAAASLVRSGAFVNSFIKVYGNSSTRPAELSLDNVTLFNARTTGIVPTATQANITVKNYNNYNPNTGVYTTAAGDLYSGYTASAWTNLL
jgi:Pectate lyase superfamily protein